MTDAAVSPRRHHAGWVAPYPWGFYIFAVVAAIGAVSIRLVDRDPAPDEPLPLTEREADDVGERSARH